MLSQATHRLSIIDQNEDWTTTGPGADGMIPLASSNQSSTPRPILQRAYSLQVSKGSLDRHDGLRIFHESWNAT